MNAKLKKIRMFEENNLFTDSNKISSKMYLD